MDLSAQVQSPLVFHRAVCVSCPPRAGTGLAGTQLDWLWLEMGNREWSHLHVGVMR